MSKILPILAITVTLTAVSCDSSSEGDRQVAYRQAVLIHSPGHFSGVVPDLTDFVDREAVLRPRREIGDSLTFARVTSVTALGDYLLVTDRFSSPHNVIIDRWTGEVVSRFGRDGEGPGEFKDARWVLPVSEHPPQAWLYDFTNRRFSLVEVNDVGEARILEEMRINVGDIEGLVWSGGRLVANGLFADHTLAHVDRMGNPLSRVVVPPPFTEREIGHPVGRMQLNRSYLAADPVGRRIAIVYQFGNRIDILSPAGKLFGSVDGPRRTAARYRVENDHFFWEEDNVMAYHGAAASVNYIYALFCGCRMGGDRPMSRVHVFRWNGDFVAELQLDRPLRSFSVTPDDALLYGAFDDPYPMVGEWLLEEVLSSE